MKNKILYKIRIGKNSDTKYCINLSKTSWPNWWAKNEELGKKHIQNCVKEKRCLVATSNKEIIAFLIWGNLWNKIHIQDIFVKENYRKIGIGTKLIEETIKIAKKRGFKEVISDCDKSNKNSITLHLKNGFKKCGIIKNNWDGEDSYVFSKKINH